MAMRYTGTKQREMGKMPSKAAAPMRETFQRRVVMLDSGRGPAPSRKPPGSKHQVGS